MEESCSIRTNNGTLIALNSKTAANDYVYAMEFAGGKVTHITKIWIDAASLEALGWA